MIRSMTTPSPVPNHLPADADKQRAELVRQLVAQQRQAMQHPAYWRPMTLRQQLRMLFSGLGAMLRWLFTR